MLCLSFLFFLSSEALFSPPYVYKYTPIQSKCQYLFAKKNKKIQLFFGMTKARRSGPLLGREGKHDDAYKCEEIKMKNEKIRRTVMKYANT